jgi:pimeloyl-ACP methyl ester carboxylesterase
MPLIERWTDRSGPRIHFLDNSPTDPVGLPILFAPGLSDTADEYVHMLEFFVPRQALVVEVRGRGRSEAPTHGYRVADHVTDLEAVLDEMSIGRFHLMTFSRGTSWGLELALHDTDRIASISIGDYRAVEVALPQEFADIQMQTRFRGRPMIERVPKHVLERLAADSTPRELWDELTRLPCPMLVARGTHGILDDEHVARYRSVRPDAEVVMVPDSGHDLFRPDRLWYPRAVARFLERTCAGF